MRSSIKSKWVGALRSGQYEQAQGRLGIFNREGGKDMYCCLGVLCDVALDYDTAPVMLASNQDQGEMQFKFGPDHFSNSLPGTNLWEWAGGDKKNAWDYSFDLDPTEEFRDWGFDSRGTYVGLDLAELNDDGFTFDQIADIIEWAEPAE